MNRVINIDIFCRDIMFHLGSPKELKRVIKKIYRKDDVRYILSKIDFSAKGYTLCNSERKIHIVYMPEKPHDSESIGFLIHELFHITTGIMEEIGVELSESSEESYAYLIGFLTKKVMEEFSICFS